MVVSSRFARLIEEVMAGQAFAVVGASRSRNKYGYKVYAALKRAGYVVYPVNPSADDIDGDPVYPLLDNLPAKPDCVVTVVPPEVTLEVIRQAGRLRIPYLWMQPGSESAACVNEAMAYGIQAVYGGPCIMVASATHRDRLRQQA